MHFSFSFLHLPIDYLCQGLFSFYLVLFSHLCYCVPPSLDTPVHCSSMCTSIISSICPLTWPGLTGGLHYSEALWALKRLITWACGHYLRVARGIVMFPCFCCFRSTLDPGIIPPFPANITNTSLHPAFTLFLHTYSPLFTVLVKPTLDLLHHAVWPLWR